MQKKMKTNLNLNKKVHESFCKNVPENFKHRCDIYNSSKSVRLFLSAGRKKSQNLRLNEKQFIPSTRKQFNCKIINKRLMNRSSDL